MEKNINLIYEELKKEEKDLHKKEKNLEELQEELR
jgi:hypothetical protein